MFLPTSGKARSLLAKEDQQRPKMTVFSDPDSDPYGVSSKQEMPWESQTPVTLSGSPKTAAERAAAVEHTKVDKKAFLAEKDIVNMAVEANDTEDVPGKGETVQEGDLSFESEADTLQDSEVHSAPPEKKPRLAADGPTARDDDL